MDVRNENNDLTVEESQLIRDYKKAQNKVIPNILSSDQIWAMDFNQLDYPNLDYVSSLRAYLDELEPYMRGLVRAAELRQLHYNQFYRGKEEVRAEDEGHRYWRLLMNEIAEDAVEKYKYWTDAHDDELDLIIDDFERTTVAEERQRLKQYQREERDRQQKLNREQSEREQRQIRLIERSMRPEQTEEEREAFRRERIRQAEQKRAEDEELLNNLIEDKTKYVNNSKISKKKMGRTISPAELTHQLSNVGYQLSYLSKFFRAGKIFRLDPNITIFGNTNELLHLAVYLLTPYDYYSQLYVYRSKVPEVEYEEYLAKAENEPVAEIYQNRPEYEYKFANSAMIDLSYDAIKLTLDELYRNDKNGLLGSALLLGMMFMRASNTFKNPEADILKILTAEIFNSFLADKNCSQLIRAINAYSEHLALRYPDAILGLKLYLANILVNWKYLSKLFVLDYLARPSLRDAVKARYKRNPRFIISQNLNLNCLKDLVQVVPKESDRIKYLYDEAYSKFMANINQEEYGSYLNEEEYGKSPKLPKSPKSPKSPKTKTPKSPKTPTLKEKNKTDLDLKEKNKTSHAEAAAARKAATLAHVNNINELLKTHSVEDVKKHLNKQLDTHVNTHLQKHLGINVSVGLGSPSPAVPTTKVWVPGENPYDAHLHPSVPKSFNGAAPALPPRPATGHQRTLPPARTMAPTRPSKVNSDGLQSYGTHTTTVTNKGGITNTSTGGVKGVVKPTK
jgi:hypothetical protein